MVGRGRADGALHACGLNDGLPASVVLVVKEVVGQRRYRSRDHEQAVFGGPGRRRARPRLVLPTDTRSSFESFLREGDSPVTFRELVLGVLLGVGASLVVTALLLIILVT